MKVVGFNGSARKDGNTAILINYVFREIEKEGIETELIQLAGKKLRGCTACYKCMKNKDQRCAVKDDKLNEYLEKIIQADGIILGSPTYFADVSPEIKALVDRVGLVSRSNGFLLKRKIGAAVIAVRRAGATNAFDSLNHLFLANQMIVPASSYWNIGIGRDKGDVEKDEEGIDTMKTLGVNMAWLLKKLHA
ncbi:MAG TPA: flavodoxin family protein [Syntrophobacteraceae bacterium]|nr:flavodoxin family protein [Syntrophobacteraceae bacterium]HBD08863.1 flavodoxin family protein [Syntrophobacteraceae bacterium]HBZ56655.1 flavodoxin family protein [Syntrophobacteraceae bacterium]